MHEGSAGAERPLRVWLLMLLLGLSWLLSYCLLAGLMRVTAYRMGFLFPALALGVAHFMPEVRALYRPLAGSRQGAWLAAGGLLALAAAGAVLASETVSRGSLSAALYFAAGAPGKCLLQIGLVGVLMLGMTLLTRRLWAGLGSVSLAVVVMSAVNYYKLIMRDEPFVPLDLFMAGKMTSLASSLNLQITPEILVACAGVFALIAVAVNFPLPKLGRRGGLIALAMAVALPAVYISGFYLSGNLAGIATGAWDQATAYADNGFLNSFLARMDRQEVQVPEGYSAQAISEALERIGPVPTSGERPNIIMIMSEGFWDLEQLSRVSYSEPLLTNFRALASQGVSGELLVPAYGGGTCNSEFEALTGFSMANLPAGSIPYNQYITQPIACLPRLLGRQGYSTLAVHPFTRDFWHRDEVYGQMGFDRYDSLEQFEDYTPARGFVSDHDLVRHIIADYAGRGDPDRPYFAFAVTIQNHTNYASDRWAQEDLLDVSAPDLPADAVDGLRDYATGIRASDRALGELAAYFAQVEQPTVIVYFGDHMNAIGASEQFFVGGGAMPAGLTGPEKTVAYHRTPFLMWDNFTDQPGEDAGMISAYQLAPLLLTRYRMAQSPYFALLARQRQVLRGHLYDAYVAPDGTIGSDPGEAAQALRDQELLQYDLMPFGEQFALGATGD
ncbi:MAG: LTA synthase family protein [Christensenellales bacterium]|jgi:phosphoglycerol transferase MdoB-like AlkP superfamily enzyme